MELLIVNPGRKRRVVRRGRRKPIRVRRVGKKPAKKKNPKRGQSASSRKGKSMASRKRRRTTVRRRKNPLRKRKSPKRVAAGKKAARTWKRQNPARSPSSFSAAMPRSALTAAAKAAGIKATGSNAQIAGRLNAAKKRRKTSAKRKSPKRVAAGKKAARTRKRLGRKATPKRRGRKMTRKDALAKARRARRVTGRKVRSARMVLRSNKDKKTRVARAKRGVARAYLKTRGIAKRAKSGRMPAGAAKLARSYGLTRVNPTGVKGALEDLRTMLVPTILPAAGGLVGAAVLGQMAGVKLSKMAWAQKQSETVKRALVPVSTLGITLATFIALKGAKGNAQRLAMPVLLGGTLATIVHTLLHTKIGQELAAKLQLPIALRHATDAQGEQAVEDGAKAANGQAEPASDVGSYMTVRQYLGAVEISKMGPSWYGRGDMSPVGDYVDAGPQEAFGSYVASDFPVHSPGPGDNVSVHASLTGLGDAYGQEGIFASGYGAAYPPGGYGAAYPPGGYGAPMMTPDYSLEETPGGTIIEPMGEAGIFGGKTAIS